MIPVQQTDFTTITGNCFAACLASILEVPLISVPHCIEDEDWYDKYQMWLLQFGLQMLCVNPHKPDDASDWTPPANTYAILGGSTCNPRCTHAVVWHGDQQVHDPGAGVVGPIRQKINWFLFVALNPAKFTQVSK